MLAKEAQVLCSLCPVPAVPHSLMAGGIGLLNPQPLVSFLKSERHTVEIKCLYSKSLLGLMFSSQVKIISEKNKPNQTKAKKEQESLHGSCSRHPNLCACHEILEVGSV